MKHTAVSGWSSVLLLAAGLGLGNDYTGPVDINGGNRGRTGFPRDQRSQVAAAAISIVAGG